MGNPLSILKLCVNMPYLRHIPQSSFWLKQVELEWKESSFGLLIQCFNEITAGFCIKVMI